MSHAITIKVNLHLAVAAALVSVLHIMTNTSHSMAEKYLAVITVSVNNKLTCSLC